MVIPNRQVADGGLFQALTESAIDGGHGYTIDTDPAFRKAADNLTRRLSGD